MKKIMKFYSYLFYRFYLGEKNKVNNNSPKLVALLTFSNIIIFNLMVIIEIPSLLLFKVSVIHFLAHNKIFAIIFVLLLLLLNNLLFASNYNFEKIMNNFSNESKQEEKKGKLIVTLFSILSFIAVVIMAILEKIYLDRMQ